MAKQDKSTRSTCAESDIVRAVRRYLEANFASKLLLRDLARFTGTSVSHLVHEFSEQLGESPKAYQNRIRVEHAKKLLLTGMPPKQVAVEVGFFDSSHLTRHFKRIVGSTPARFVGI